LERQNHELKFTTNKVNRQLLSGIIIEPNCAKSFQHANTNLILVNLRRSRTQARAVLFTQGLFNKTQISSTLRHGFSIFQFTEIHVGLSALA